MEEKDEESTRRPCLCATLMQLKIDMHGRKDRSSLLRLNLVVPPHSSV